MMAWYSSLFGGGASGGGGSQDSMGQMGSLMNVASNTNKKVQDALEEPYRIRRARILELAPQALEIGTGIQPVASSRGGAAMVGAMARERGVRQNMALTDQTSRLDLALRNNYAAGQVAKRSAAIVRRIASMIAGGAMAGGGGATPAGTGAEMSPVEGGGAMSAGSPLYGTEAGSYGSGVSTGGSFLGGAANEYLRGYDGGGEGDENPYLSRRRYY